MGGGGGGAVVVGAVGAVGVVGVSSQRGVVFKIIIGQGWVWRGRGMGVLDGLAVCSRGVGCRVVCYGKGKRGAKDVALILKKRQVKKVLFCHVCHDFV